MASRPAGAVENTGQELIVNGGFEQWAGGRPEGWTISTGAKEGEGPESIGRSGLLNGIIQAVAERKKTEKIGRCFVITGRATFSSAALNTLDFRRATGALVVGEPMGSKPNRYGQLSVFSLPYSGLQVQYDTKHFIRVEGDPPVLAPDIPVEPGWEDYLEGRDPAMERILAIE